MIINMYQLNHQNMDINLIQKLTWIIYPKAIEINENEYSAFFSENNLIIK